jgi:sugar O-acyltransferase (sialic acid O-acetyltransferase NeuD family)
LKNLLIFPFNGNGLEAISCLSNEYNLLGFIDDIPLKQGKTSNGISVFTRDAIRNNPEALILAVPGSPTSYKTRKDVIGSLNIDYPRFATIIHPNASISPLAKIGKNVLIMSGVVITSNAVIGDHVCILPNSVIHHDTSIGEYTLIGSNVSVAGHSTVGANCYIGTGTSIINNITIGARTLIGLGSTVIKSLPEDSKAAGNPARLL